MYNYKQAKFIIFLLYFSPNILPLELSPQQSMTTLGVCGVICSVFAAIELKKIHDTNMLIHNLRQQAATETFDATTKPLIMHIQTRIKSMDLGNDKHDPHYVNNTILAPQELEQFTAEQLKKLVSEFKIPRAHQQRSLICMGVGLTSSAIALGALLSPAFRKFLSQPVF